MKAALILGAIVQVASAHYFFDTNVVNGVAQTPLKYIRRTTRGKAYNPTKFSSNPAADIRDGSYIDGPDARCNQNAFAAAGQTQVLTIKAGDQVTARLGAGATMGHPGPSLVYMSRAPGDNVKAYDGSGDWFKIYQDGLMSGGDFQGSAWVSFNKRDITAKVPAGTPSGEYLIRFEHIGIHRSHVNQPEHFISCLQVKVTNGGSGSPGPMVKFPGAYKNTDGYANYSIYGARKDFPMPGPAVWNGSGNSGGNPTSPAPTTTRGATSPQPTSGGGGGAALYGQCGGIGFTGPTSCSSGKCVRTNEYYSQCMP